MVKDGYKFAVPPLALGLLLCLLGERGMLGATPRWAWAAGVLIILGLFVLFFFRDPDRAIPDAPGLVVSPADGRVMEVVQEAFDARPGRRVSIFLSVFNVHVNRSPVAGEIREVSYRQGRFYAAMRSRASAENEQNVIRIATPAGEMAFKQIAGWIARRVLFWKSAGVRVVRGERVGMIRFGSRVDVWLPLEAEILVRPGQNVAGGSSVLARWNNSN
ncbi:MAG: phosphatidylserine decarboxylase family protein [Candidatus Acidiferrales bacterium]